MKKYALYDSIRGSMAGSWDRLLRTGEEIRSL